jgi:GT2 family glycosyltransferase
MHSNETATGLSIVVLTYNRRKLLRGCLESLLAQEDPGIPLSFLIVDDGSTDGTGAMVQEWAAARPQWRAVSQSHRGIAAARNAGIRGSVTEWIAIVADDYFLPADYARTIAVFFNDHPQAHVLRFKVVPDGGDFMGRALHAYREASVIRRLPPRNPRGKPYPEQEEGIITDHTLEAAGAAAFRRKVFQQVGDFDETFVRGEDTDFTRRLNVAGILVHYSPHLRIRHRDAANLGTALKNAFISGHAAWRLYATPGQKPASIPYLIQLALRSGPAALYWACWRAWQTGRPALMFTYFPVMLCLETSTRAGFFHAGIRSRKKSPARRNGLTQK